MDESVDQETSGRQEEEKEEENFVKKPSLLGRMGIFGGKSLGVKSKRELALKSGEGLVSQATSTLFNSL